MGYRAVFFKDIKQNIQLKTFEGTCENAIKSNIYVAFTSYLLLELINRTITKKTKSFSNFVEKKRIPLVYNLSIKYVCNQASEGTKKVNKQTKLAFETDLFIN